MLETKPQDFAADRRQPWYAIYTRFRHEKAVAQLLDAKGFETFLPLYDAVHRWKDRPKQLSLPLFPCYVFVRGEMERKLAIVTTPGIHAVVSNAGRPTPIPVREIEQIRRAIQAGARLEPHPLLKCGEWVRVKAGTLAGLEGILVRKKNLFRLVLSVEMLGKAAAVEVDSSSVEKASRRAVGKVATRAPVFVLAAAIQSLGPNVSISRLAPGD